MSAGGDRWLPGLIPASSCPQSGSRDGEGQARPEEGGGDGGSVSRGTPVRSGCPPRGERALFTPALHAWPLAGRQGHSQGIRDDSGSVTGAVHGVLSAPGPWPAARAPFLQGFIPNGPSQRPLRPAPEPGWTRSKESVTCHSPSTLPITSPHTCPRQATQAGQGSPPETSRTCNDEAHADGATPSGLAARSPSRRAGPPAACSLRLHLRLRARRRPAPRRCRLTAPPPRLQRTTRTGPHPGTGTREPLSVRPQPDRDSCPGDSSRGGNKRRQQEGGAGQAGSRQRCALSQAPPTPAFARVREGRPHPHAQESFSKVPRVHCRATPWWLDKASR